MSSIKRKAVGQINGSGSKKARQNVSITSYFSGPMSTATATSSNGTKSLSPTNGGSTASEPAAPKFDKAKWVTSLTDEQKELLQLEIETLDDSWLAQLKGELLTKEFLDLKRFLNKEASQGKTIFPPRDEIYSWSQYTPFHNVKVVIIGQDPYHNHNQAHGLAFSVRPPTPAPPSLKNIYKALAIDYPSFTAPPNRSGLLTPWAKRGVLLLNTCLTVRAHEANSHANHGWERFTQKVIDLVAARRNGGVVFMAWGTPAAKRVQKIDKERHLVLKSVHPSPLSASRGFFDCGHFKHANEWLVSRYGARGEIHWSLGSDSGITGMAPAVANERSFEEDIDDTWEAEATAAITVAEAKTNVMGPPPIPSPNKPSNVAMQDPSKFERDVGKENLKQALPA